MGWLTRQQAQALSEEDREAYLIRTVLGEAVGEGYPGMLGVAQVIQNRADDGRWPSDPVAVAGQSWQFSTNSDGTGGNQAMVRGNYGPNTPEWGMAKAAVRAAIYDRDVPDITGNAVQYHSIAMGWPSSWPTSIKKHGQIDIGGHRYYPSHPVPPGEIPQILSSLQYNPAAGRISSTLNQRGVDPIRPATMSDGIRLSRELNRVAQQKANAPETIKRSRAFAFSNVIDPFEGPLRSNVDLVINRPVPAMKESMQRQLRATGTPNTTERTFAQLVTQEGMDAPGVTLVSARKPPAVQSAPWGVRERMAAVVASTEAGAGRGQMTMTGNANIPGAVVDWLYPRIAEGEGEANQDGKGNRAPRPVGQTTIERNVPPKQAPGQSTIERGSPIVVVDRGKARVVPQSQIERNTPNLVAASVAAANKANDPELAASLAASIAARPAQRVAVTAQTQRTAADLRQMRDANQAATPAGKPAVTTQGQQTAADIATMRQANQNAGSVAQPRNAINPGKDMSRLTPIETAIRPVAVAPVKLPPLAPAKSNPIGIMPKFQELTTGLPQTPKTQKKAPIPASVDAREIARGSTLFGQPSAPEVPVGQPTAEIVQLPRRRPDRVEAPRERVVPSVRVTTTAPQPASVDDRITARNRATTVAPPGLSVVVQRDRPAPARPAAPAKAAAPAASGQTAVERLQSQGYSASESYERANSEASQRAIENASPRYQDANALWRDITG